MKENPLILITNDDGVTARGIQELTASLRDLGRLVVFAPDSPRSGMSGAITTAAPVSYEFLVEENDLAVYQCSGTPVDCVKLALHLGIRPDLLVSGINHGGNMSICVHYSGTLGAAIEGCILGIPSIGLSLDFYGEKPDFSESCRLGRALVEYVLKEGLPQGSYLNLNVPALAKVKGVKVCRQADALFTGEYITAEERHGPRAYSLAGELSIRKYFSDNDTTALNDGYASLVPCKIDVTDYDFMKELSTNHIFR
ncbi:MAG: 5'/3'-nucleotidase SurE [Tannerellaceae bacterium]|jgi:5'-nucleotidase|nr:5'/3'-nucleotidase SurE [Tannerellaceae bacterium]